MLAIVVLALSAHSALPAKIPELPLPDYVERACYRTDPNLDACLMDVGNKAIKSVAEGDKKYCIPKLNPFIIPKIMINQGSKQVGLTAVCNNCALTGLEKAIFTSSKTNVSKREAAWSFHIDDVEVKGQYNATGRVLLLPINGIGTAIIHAKNINFTLFFTWTVEKRANNLDYLEVKDFRSEYKVGGLTMKLDGLFNGDKFLGDTMNNFLNENWEQLIKELGPPISEALGQVFLNTLKAMAQLIPLDNLFPK